MITPDLTFEAVIVMLCVFTGIMALLMLGVRVTSPRQHGTLPPAQNPPICRCGQTVGPMSAWKCDDCAGSRCRICGKGPLPAIDDGICGRCGWAEAA